MVSKNIQVLDPKHGSQFHLVMPDGEDDKTLVCDSPIVFEDATMIEKSVQEIGPENTCAHCLRKAIQMLHNIDD